MPLQGPGHFKQNVRTLMGEIGKSPHVQSRAQALAIAYSKERGRAEGGIVREWNKEDLPLPYDRKKSERVFGKSPTELKEGEDFDVNWYQPRSIIPREEQALQRGGEVGGLVDHDYDPELPRVSEDVSLEPMMAHQHDPAYLQVIQRLVEGQKRLNALLPGERERVRRYAFGGIVRAMARGGLV